MFLSLESAVYVYIYSLRNYLRNDVGSANTTTNSDGDSERHSIVTYGT